MRETSEYDFHVSNFGSLWTITPLTEAGLRWANEHLLDGFVVEARYMPDIVEGMIDDDLLVETTAT